MKILVWAIPAAPVQHAAVKPLPSATVASEPNVHIRASLFQSSKMYN